MPSTAVFDCESDTIQGKQHWGVEHDRAVVAIRGLESQVRGSPVFFLSGSHTLSPSPKTPETQLGKESLPAFLSQTLWGEAGVFPPFNFGFVFIWASCIL